VSGARTLIGSLTAPSLHFVAGVYTLLTSSAPNATINTPPETLVPGERRGLNVRSGGKGEPDGSETESEEYDSFRTHGVNTFEQSWTSKAHAGQPQELLNASTHGSLTGHRARATPLPVMPARHGLVRRASAEMLRVW
jgi:hypothetical protein